MKKKDSFWKQSKFLLGLVIFLLVLTAYTGFWGFFKDLSFYLTEDFFQTGTRVGNTARAEIGFWVRLKELRKELARYKDSYQELQVSKAKILELEKENEELRAQLDLQEEKDFSLLPAEIVAKEPSNFIKFLTINRGEKDGVKEKMAVVSSTGLLVGQIWKTFPNTAQVLLITDIDSVVPVLVQRSRADGVLKGQLGYGLIMEYLSKEKSVGKNDLVVTSGLGQTFPKGILVGMIDELEGDPSDIFRRAHVRPFVVFNQLEQVAVITAE